MKRYLKLYYHFFRLRLMREMEFRTNFIVWNLINFFWLGLGLASVELLFGQISAIAGWDKNEVLLLVLTVSLFNDFMWTFVFTNLNDFSRLIRHGELDYVLMKPVSPRFIVSSLYLEFDHFLRMILLIFLVSRLLKVMLIKTSFLLWSSYWLIFLMTSFAFYNLFFTLVVTNFWFIRLFNFTDLVDSFINIGRYPMGVFKGRVRFLLTYLIPVAFVAYFPVMVLLGRTSPAVVFVAVGTAALTFLFSQWFWRFALKRYSSASS